jgi:hypothetical protein
LGRTVGRNLQIDNCRGAGDADRYRAIAAGSHRLLTALRESSN